METDTIPRFIINRSIDPMRRLPFKRRVQRKDGQSEPLRAAGEESNEYAELAATAYLLERFIYISTGIRAAHYTYLPVHYLTALLHTLLTIF